jgi:hypothetical protein
MDPTDASHDNGPLAPLQSGPANDAPTPRAATPPPPRLLDRVRTEIRTRYYSLRTEDAYVDWVRPFILFHGKRHPQEMGAEEVGQFLSWLATERQLSASTQNQAKAALLFLYAKVLQQDLPWINEVVSACVHKRLPVVLTPTEVRAAQRHEWHHRLAGRPWQLLEAKRVQGCQAGRRVFPAVKKARPFKTKRAARW